MASITNLEVLKKAFSNLGWSTVAKSTCRTWYSNPDRHTVYDWVAVNPSVNGYDLALVQDRNTKAFSFHGDTYMMGQDVWDVLGKDFAKLKQMYSVCNLEAETARQMGQTTVTQLANGVVRVEMEMEVFV